MCRDMGYYWVRIIVYILLSLCVGTIFYRLGTNYTSIFARGACAGFISGFMTFMSIGGFPSFLEEMKVRVISKGDFINHNRHVDSNSDLVNSPCSAFVLQTGFP